MSFVRYATGLWTKLNVVVSVVIAATRRSARVVPSGKCILYSASDANRGLRGDEGYFSPILDPIQDYYHKNSYEVVNLSYPLSYYDSQDVKGGALLLNRAAIWIFIVSLAEQLALGKTAAAMRKSARRVLLLKKLIGAFEPKLIIAFQATPELCQAAHELKISVVEPMHGMNLSPDDAIFRSTIVGIKSHSLPDAYLAYDDRTVETLRELLGKQEIGVFRVPHPAHITAHEIGKNSLAGGNFLGNLPKSNSIRILVTLQWGYDGERESLSNIIPNGVLHPAVERAIVENQNVIWFLRLHPVQMRSRSYGKHRQYVRTLSERYANVEWENATSLPLATLLANVQGHITMTSGSAGEAAIFGVPSLLLCPTLKPDGAHSGWFSELAHDGMIEFGELESQYVLEWISRIAVPVNEASRKNWEIEKEKLNRALDSILEQYAND